jgi:hypothetical protein
MKAISLVARVDFEYDGQPYKAGDPFFIAAPHAVVLINRHLATLPKREKPAPPPPEKPKRTYRRKDQTAETADKPRTKRTYRRKDQVAEE